ncbi:MAG: hypothetical protein WD768_12425 [Phycisphaeraceae bacterium]
MSQASFHPGAGVLPLEQPRSDARRGARWFAAVAVLLIASAAILAGWMPIGFSIVTVFLFAGPHNWFEFRYFLSRMPARWGPRRTYFLVGIGGAFGLTFAFIAYTWIGIAAGFSMATWETISAIWNTTMVLWIASLLQIRGSERQGRDWSWCWMLAFIVAAVGWLAPLQFGIAMVYLHPVVAMVFLDREIARRKPAWLRTYRALLMLVPAVLVMLWWRLGSAPDLPGMDALSVRITRHAGGGIGGIAGTGGFASTHFLVAAHTFLEMLHYSVWLIAMPLVAMGLRPWSVAAVPLAKKSLAFRRLALAIVLIGAALVVIFWLGFLADYPRTRDIYFTVAMLHVLAEFPFLIRSM